MSGHAPGGPPLLRNFVDGEFVDGGRHFVKSSPVTGEPVFTSPRPTAPPSTPRSARPGRRCAGRGGGWASGNAPTCCGGSPPNWSAASTTWSPPRSPTPASPIAQARTLDIPRGAANFRAFAEIVATAPTESFTTVTPAGGRALNYALRKPVGVVAIIVPWNLPLLLLTWKVAPALACGNAVVVKPSEETPASATLLAEVMAAAGVPDGVFNLVHGFGPDSAGEFLTRHPGVDAITFTGESATGSAIMRAAADGVKAVSFELGGKNAGLVFADADLDAAVAGSVRSSFTNGGQVCLCTERIYVQRPVFDEFAARLAKRGRRAGVRLAGRRGHGEHAADLPPAPRQGARLLRPGPRRGRAGARRRRRARPSATPATAARTSSRRC